MMQKDSKIYVAGSEGLVGSAIVRRLRNEGYANIVTRSHAELDLTRQEETEKFFHATKPEYVFLCAARVGGILANSTYKAEFIYQNIMIAANIIDASYRTGVKKLLNLGSSCIYPKFANQPMNEKDLLTGLLEPTNEPYAIAKISAIKMCRYYNEQYGTNYLSCMPTNLYGSHDNYDLDSSHVLPALIRKVHLAKLLAKKDINTVKDDLISWDKNTDVVNGTEEEIVKFLKKHHITAETVGIWGTGSPYREFLYVDDLADACVTIMGNYDFKQIGEIVNIGYGSEITIRDLARLIKDVVGFRGDLLFDSTKPDGAPRKLLDITKMRSLGWTPKTSLKEGIKKTYEWYITSTGARR